jgi:hypothetical protein
MHPHLVPEYRQVGINVRWVQRLNLEIPFRCICRIRPYCQAVKSDGAKPIQARCLCKKWAQRAPDIILTTAIKNSGSAARGVASAVFPGGVQQRRNGNAAIDRNGPPRQPWENPWARARNRASADAGPMPGGPGCTAGWFGCFARTARIGGNSKSAAHKYYRKRVGRWCRQGRCSGAAHARCLSWQPENRSV